MANLIGAAYKWRIDNNVYSYITNTEGGEPFIVSGSTECNEELIRNKVQNFTKEQYESKFQEMVSAVHAYNNGKYSYVQFLDYTIYMNEAEHCDIYNRPDVVTDVDFTVCATTLPSDSEATVGIYTTDEDIECREGEKIRKYHIDFGIPKGSRFIPITVTDEELTQNGEQIIRENDILSGDFLVSVDSNTIWSCSKDYQFINSGVQLNATAYRYFANINAYSFGENDIAKGVNSITEGYATVAGYEGSYNQIDDIGEDIAGYYSHAEGNATAAAGSASHAEGKKTYASGIASHAEGYNTFASGTGAHAEGQSTQSIASKSHAEGYHTEASGECSHAEGNNAKATGANSHAEGLYTESNGANSHSEGSTCIANGISAHAEGNNTQAIANGSHAEGSGSIGSGPYSHVEGGYNTTYGECSHAEGTINIAYGKYSHVEGKGNVSKNDGQHISGTYAEIDETGNAIFQVGIGTNDNTRKDAFRINKDGSFVFAVPENAEAPIFTFVSSAEQQEASAINEEEGEPVQTYNMRRSAARQTSIPLTTSNFIDLINLQQNIDDAINGIEFPVNQEDLDDLQEKLAEDFEDIIDEQENNYNNSIAEVLSKTSDLQSQIDGEATAWFLKGEPCDKWGTIDTNKEPAKDWNVDGTNGKESYASHKGDTYTDITEKENGEIGKSWRFCYCERKKGDGENDIVTDWHWHEIGDASVARALYEASRAQSTADGKSTVYISKDEDGNRVPDHYQAGDMWIINDIALQNGGFIKEGNTYYTKESGKKGTPISVGEMLTANANSKEYNVEHWSKEIKYTDDSYAIEAKNRADEAYEYAESGHTSALKAIELLNGISSDGRVYPNEFKELTLKIQTINSEKIELVGQDGKGGEASLWETGVDSADDYFNAANRAISALTYYTDEKNFEIDTKTQESLGYIQILNSDENKTHVGYWGNITNYYIKRQELLNDIADASKAYADEIEGLAEQAANAADSAQEAADNAAQSASAALGMLDDVDNDDVVAITEFAALESELEVIERDLTEIIQSIELYKGSDLYDRLKSATSVYEITGTTVTYTGYTTYQTAQIKAVNALKYHCGKTATKDGINVVAGENDKNEHGSIIIKTSKKNNAITTPFEIDYENIVKYYAVRQSMLEHIAFVAKLYAESLQTELSPENVAEILKQIKIDGVNLVTGSRCDFVMGQWGSTNKLTAKSKVDNDYTQTTINEDSKLSFCTSLYDKITNKQWESEYVSVSIDVFIPKDNVTEEDKQNPKKVNFGIVLRNGSVDLFSAYATNIECVYNDWTRLKLTFHMEKDITDVFTKNGTDYLVNRVYLVVNDSDSSYNFKAGTTFKFRKIQIEFNTTCSSWYPSPEDIDEIYSVAVDAQTNADAAKKAAEDSMNILTDMSSDNKLTPQEKVDIRKEWGEIQEEYKQALSDVQRAWRDHGFTDPQEYNDYENAYDSLDDCLSLLDINKETTIDISTISGTIFSVKYTGREYFNKAFSIYYAKHVAFMNCLAEQLAYLEVRSIEIGGVNLLIGTGDTPKLLNTSADTETYKGSPVAICKHSGSNSYKDYSVSGNTIGKLENNGTYILSFDIKGGGEHKIEDKKINAHFYNVNFSVDKITNFVSKFSTSWGTTGSTSDGLVYLPITTSWKRLWIKYTLSNNVEVASVKPSIIFLRINSGYTNNIYITNIQLEKGDVATAWSEAPEDSIAYIEEIKGYTDSIKNSLQSQIDGVVDSYFMEGEPTKTNKPASDWNENGTDGKDSYAQHEGDTYTDISEITLLTSSMWEQGSLSRLEERYQGVTYDNQKTANDGRFRTKVLMDNKPGQTVYVPENYHVCAMYYNNNGLYYGHYSDNTKNFTLPEYDSDGSKIYKISFLVYHNTNTTNLPYKLSDELKLCINPTAGQSWRWCRGNSGESIGWHWHKIADSDAVKALQVAAAAQDTADSKRRVFTDQPYTPYDVGDLWVKTDVNNTSLNDTLYCQSGKTSGSFDSKHWVSSTAALEALNTANSALTNVQNVDFLTQVMQSGVTESKGGLFLTNIIALRDSNNTLITGGMSGIKDDNVLLWGGGTYNHAVSAAKSPDYISAGTGIPITTLIKKDGTGKIGAFFIDKDTVKVVSDTQTTIITNKTINQTAPLQTTINGRTGDCSLDASSSYSIKVDEFGNAFGYYQIISCEVTGLTVNGGYTINVSVSDITLSVSCSDYLHGEEEFNNCYCIAQGYLNGFKVIVNDGTSTNTVLAEKTFSSGGSYSKYVYVDPNYQIRTETSGSFKETTSSGNVSFKTKTNKIKVILQSFVYGKTDLSDFSREYDDVVSNASPNVYFKCSCTHTIKGTDKYTVIAKDGIAISSNSDAQFYIDNSSSNLKIRMNGLPTSKTNLKKGDLYLSGSTLMVAP